MWRDEDGTFHTVAMPDPSLVMTPRFHESLGRLIVSASVGVAQVVEDEEERFYDEARAVPADVTGEAAFVGVPPPVVLSGAFDTLDGLKAIIEQVDDRWRLDALMALDDTIGDHEF